MNWAKNLKAHQVFPGAPWDFTDTSNITDDLREDKARRDAWINNVETEHNVFSLFEGVNPNCRIYTDKDNDGNPPRKQYGVVCDFDAPATFTDVQNGMLRIGPHKPAWWGRSMSGHAHVVWLFEKALNLPEDSNLVRRWMKFLREKISFHLFLIGFETGAFDEPTRRYTNGAHWQKLSDYVIPDETVRGWFVEFANKCKWEEIDHNTTTIPLEEAAKILSEKYPRFAEWPGDFVVGSQGPSFWIPGSTSPKSAIVRETGIFTFSGHASKSMWLWEDRDLLGPDFVSQYKAQELGRAVTDIYWDEKVFHQKDGKGLWTVLNKDDTVRHLVEKGVSNRRDPVKRLAPTEQAINHIQKFQRIAGAAPFIYRQEQLIYIAREPYLNIANVEVLSPAPGVWTFDSKCLPFLYPFLTNLFCSPEQLPFFMAWLARTYQYAYIHDPRLGQSVFVCGPAGVGKTFLNRAVVGPILGGFQDAAKFLSGAETFGSEMFKVPTWVVDDNTTLSTPAKRRYYTEILKALAANREFKFHEKFRVPALTYWIGRVFVTMNADEESVRGLPDLGRSNMDKMMFFRTVEKAPVVFPSEDRIREILKVELPIFAAVLLKWEIPAHVRSGETRYEVTSYHEPTLLNTAQQSSPLASFEDILDNWTAEYFKSNPKLSEWTGTPFQLQVEILRDPASEMAMRDYSLDRLNTTLSGLKNRDYPVEILEQNGKRLIRIKRPKNLPAPTTPETVTPPQNPNSQFNK